MRILSIGLLYPPLYLGGYELLCEGAMRAARARGHEVQVLVSDYRAAEAVPSEEPGVDRSLRSYLDASAKDVGNLGIPATLRLERYDGRVLERHLREFAPEVVSWWGVGGLPLSLIERVRRAGVPSVFCIEDYWLWYGTQMDRWSNGVRRLRLARLAPVLEPLLGIPVGGDLEGSGRFLFNSPYLAERAAAAGFHPRDSAIVSPGVHSRFLTAAPPEPWRGRLLYVGRVERTKAVDVIIAALALLPEEVTLRIVGSGNEDYSAELRSQAAELGVAGRVEFAEAIAAEQLPSVYADSDAVVFPVRWKEPWGLVPLEAMAVGRPVVATSRGGAATYLRDGENALLIPLDDAGALAAAVQRLAGSAELRERLREGGLRTAAQYTAERHDKQVLDELERAGRRGASAAQPGSSRSAR